jgi:hypothetical protein
MRSTIVRLGGVAVGLLALVGGLTPPAHATTVLAAAFVGTATLAAPFGYPCVGTGATLTIDTRLCPTEGKMNNPNILAPSDPTDVLQLVRLATHAAGLLTASQLTLPGALGAVPQHHIDLHHNRTTVTVTSVANQCVDVAANVSKPGKAPTHAGLCSFGPDPTPPLSSTAAGNCGLSSGQVAVRFRDALGQDFDLDLHFLGLGGVIVFEGHSVKVTGGQRGLVVGVTLAIPPIPTVTAGSCTNKTARTFTLVGNASAAG